MPELVGRYRLGRTLGQGTYGKVKLGVSGQGERVAVKIIEKANIQSERQVARIQREIRFLKLLHHPNIVRVYEIHETVGQIYIVMEHIEGGELFDYIVTHKRIKEREARGFVRMICSALGYCHANGIIHRDLKPENLLLDTKQSIKIIDFGFGNTIKPKGLLNTYCGSPFYAAPEMILGKPYEGPEVDLWSLGVIMYALLCGHLPFDDENIKELYKKIANGTYSIPSFLSNQASDLISKLLVVDSKNRATLPFVCTHPWVCEGYSGPPDLCIPPRPTVGSNCLIPDIVSRLQAFGYTMQDITEAFSDSSVNPIRATYFLLIEMVNRETIQSARRRICSSLHDQSERMKTRSATVPGQVLYNQIVHEPRTVSSWFLNVNTTSAKSVFEILEEIKNACKLNNIVFKHESPFIVECKSGEVSFEIEVCRVPRLSLHGLHFKRINGGMWTYKKVCNKVLGSMNL